MFHASPPTQGDRSTTALAGHTYLIEAEAHVRQAARLIELNPALDAQRTARALFRFASRLRSDRLAAA
jgi:hypothetical protein